MSTKRPGRHRPIPYLYTLDTKIEPQKVCEALINGVSITLIDPQIYDRIIDAINQYIGEKSLDESSQEYSILKKCVDQMENYIHPSIEDLPKIPENIVSSFSSAPKKFHRSPEKEKLYKEKYDMLMNAVLYSQQFPAMNQQEREELISIMQCEKKRLNDEENFRDAIAMQQGIIRIQKVEQAAKRNEIKECEQGLLITKKNSAEENYKDVKERWDGVVKQFRIYRVEETSKFVEKNQNELKELEEKLANGPPPTFRKESQALIDMRAKKDQLVEAKEFKEAEKLKYEIKIREKIEEQETREEWTEYCKSQIQQMKDRHNKDLEVHVMAFDKEEEKIKEEMNSEIQAAYNKVQYYHDQLLLRNESRIPSPEHGIRKSSPRKQININASSSYPSANVIRNPKASNTMFAIRPPSNK